MPSHVDQHPAPAGPMPPDPGPKPEYKAETWSAEYDAWQKRIRARNDWVVATRMHLVAKAVDAIETTFNDKADDAGNVIAYVLGVSYLEGRGAIEKPGTLGIFGL